MSDFYWDKEICVLKRMRICQISQFKWSVLCWRLCRSVCSWYVDHNFLFGTCFLWGNCFLWGKKWFRFIFWFMPVSFAINFATINFRHEYILDSVTRTLMYNCRESGTNTTFYNYQCPLPFHYTILKSGGSKLSQNNFKANIRVFPDIGIMSF